MQCQTCSCELVDGVLTIRDMRRWVASEIPCQECETRHEESLREMAARYSEAVTMHVLDFVVGS